MSNIKISFTEVSEKATELNQLNQKMYDELNKIKSLMMQTNVSWISDAGEAIRSRFQQFSIKFEREKETIDSYIKFLNFAVSSYETLETTIHSNASNINS